MYYTIVQDTKNSWLWHVLGSLGAEWAVFRSFADAVIFVAARTNVGMLFDASTFKD